MVVLVLFKSFFSRNIVVSIKYIVYVLKIPLIVHLNAIMETEHSYLLLVSFM